MRVVRVNMDGEGFAEPEPSFSENHDLEPVEEADEDAFPLVLVTWHDAWFDFDQATADDSRPDYLVKTVGFLVSEGPRFLSVAQEVLPDGDGFRAVTHIPLSIVESIVSLDEGDPRLRPAG